MNTVKQTEEMPVIRKADLENHNKDGGLWIVINGKVYDVQEFRWVESNFSKCNWIIGIGLLILPGSLDICIDDTGE